MTDSHSDTTIFNKLNSLEWADFACLFNNLCRRPVYIDFSQDIQRMKEMWEHEELRDAICTSLEQGRIPTFLFPATAPKFNDPNNSKQKQHILRRYLDFLTTIHVT